MAIGDEGYHRHVSPETRIFIDQNGLGNPDEVIQGGENAPFYPDSVRAFLFDEPIPDDSGFWASETFQSMTPEKQADFRQRNSALGNESPAN